MILVSIASCSLLNNEYVREIETERIAKDSSFLLIGKSPLSSDQIDYFGGLKYFKIDKKYVLEARMERISSDEVIQMKTSTDRMANYRVFASVYFQLEEKEHKLTAYQNISLQKDSVYKNYLFIPFTDDNSTISTYGGGRYLDIEIPKGDTFTLDFNMAYNPYCAYNHKWSCVIPPRENSLTIAIDAGEKIYTDVH